MLVRHRLATHEFLAALYSMKLITKPLGSGCIHVFRHQIFTGQRVSEFAVAFSS